MAWDRKPCHAMYEVHHLCLFVVRRVSSPTTRAKNTGRGVEWGVRPEFIRSIVVSPLFWFPHRTPPPGIVAQIFFFFFFSAADDRSLSSADLSASEDLILVVHCFCFVEYTGSFKYQPPTPPALVPGRGGFQ